MSALGGIMLSENQVAAVLVKTDKAVARLQKRVNAQRDIQLEAIRNLSMRCGVCEGCSPLHRWTFVQNRYYVEPTGCTEGDYWVTSPFKDCTMRCPACRQRHHIRYRADMEFLIELMNKRHFELTKLFDPEIIVEAQR